MAAPRGLGRRGRVLWKALGQSVDTAAGALALEACRTADRCEELDSVIHGKGVLELAQFRLNLDFTDDETNERTVHITVQFGAVLAEARQQQMALKQLIAQLASLKPAAGGATTPVVGTTAATKTPLELVRERHKGNAG